MFKLIGDIYFIFILLFTIYVTICFYQTIRNSNELLAVQWCRKNNNIDSWHYGIYLYMEPSKKGEIIVRGQFYDSRMLSVWSPYRISLTDIISTESNAKEAIRKWSKIECGENKKIIIGEQKITPN